MFPPTYFVRNYFPSTYFVGPSSLTISTEDDFSTTYERFKYQQERDHLQVMQEDEELIIIARAFIEIISCRH